ncbi:MAG: hypothetical protein ABIP75_19315 [Pyrinomonadaceae bacterium]
MKQQIGRCFGLVATVGLIMWSTSCTRETAILVGGGNSPQFTVSGSGRLTSLQVFGSASNDPEVKPSLLLWQIEPTGDARSGLTLDELRSISFGQVPPGYVQRFPLSGARPAVLTEGADYRAQFDTSNASGLTLQFGLRNGQTVNLTSVSNHRNIPTH